MLGPKVSIVMPCYNVARFLDYALLGISGQSYRNFELIAIDDGSTDQTIDMLVDAQQSLPLKIVRMKDNRGLPAALNAGLESASGDLIARFDPDDFMLDWRLRDQVYYLLENTDIDLVGGGAKTFEKESFDLWPKTSHEDVLSEFLLNNPFIHPTIMFRRKLLDEGFFVYKTDLITEEDYELWSRLLPRIKTANISYPLIKYRIHSSNGQRNPGKKAIKEIAINQFLAAYGVENQDLASVLAEYQCSQFMSHHAFEVMKEFVSRKRPVPQLGWIHHRLARAKNFAEFTADMW